MRTSLVLTRVCGIRHFLTVCDFRFRNLFWIPRETTSVTVNPLKRYTFGMYGTGSYDMTCHGVVGMFSLVLGRCFGIVSQPNAGCVWLGSLAVAR